jgi:hypothetical protein
MSSKPMTHSNQEEDQLAFTGRLFGGLRNDLARKAPHYFSDYKEGFSSKVLGSVSFLFFACLANAIAFGALTSVLTGGEIGTVEMIVATAIGGIVFAIFSGQPLTILGGTGPIVIFTALLYELCQAQGLPFLPVYAWVGIWSGLLLLVLVATDASALMRLFTKFTDEIFAALVAVIFLVEALTSVITPLVSVDTSTATALMTIILSFGTFFLAKTFKGFINTRFFNGKVRSFVSDFGPALAILVMTLFALSMPSVQLSVPAIPETFGTTTGRAWMIDLFSIPTWMILFCIGPAILVTVLLFLDQNITTRLVNNPAYSLRKGGGYHLDLTVVGGLVLVASVFGLPWIVAATVHSLNHVKSLSSTADSAVKGEPQQSKVTENRVSGLLIHLLIGCSIFLLPLVKAIPMEVLFGLFLFMGISTLNGTDLFERCKLWMIDKHLYPQEGYMQRVPMKVVRSFTVIQVGALGLLWVLKSSALGILFPLLIAMLVPLRQLLSRYFDDEHLTALDEH